ncbi:unnamed protein product, partial [Polarella glacialis]
MPHLPGSMDAEEPLQVAAAEHLASLPTSPAHRDLVGPVSVASQGSEVAEVQAFEALVLAPDMNGPGLHQPELAEDSGKQELLSRELTDITVTSQTPLLDDLVQVPERSSVPVIPTPSTLAEARVPSIDDFSTDFLEVPSELPATVPSAPFFPQPRSSPPSATAFPRVEAFLGRPVLVACQADAFNGPPSLEMIRKLLANRRVETALALLQGEGLPKSIEASLLRLRCLSALRRHQEAAQECSALVSAHGEKSVPFEARLLSAHLPFLLNPGNDAAQSLGQLQALAQQSGDASAATWCERLQLLRVLSHVSLAAGHGRVAADEIRKVISVGVMEGEEALTAPRRREDTQLYSLLGRHYVSWGDPSAAERAFDLARDAGLQEDTAAAQLNRGLVAMLRGDYAAARVRFAAASAAASAALLLANSISADGAEAAMAAEEALGAENNLAVCRLYTRELKAAREGLEACIKQDPMCFLKPCVIQNLVSLYEFSSDAPKR